LHSFANAELTSPFLFATLPICLALAWRPAAVPSAITTSVLVFILCAVWNVHLSRATSFVWATLTATVVACQLIVVLAKSGARIEVPPGVSILEAMRARGHAAPSSCESGTCGTCRTALVAGEPDHRDLVLAEEERAREIMICVSRARSPELVIDR